MNVKMFCAILPGNIFFIFVAATKHEYLCNLYNKTLPQEYSDPSTYMFNQQQENLCKDVSKNI
jgi:hypothetical protein